MFEDLKKAQRKRKKKKMVAQRAKAEQAHAAQKKQGKASARPNIPSSSVRESLNSVSESSAEARANKQQYNRQQGRRQIPKGHSRDANGRRGE